MKTAFLSVSLKSALVSCLLAAFVPQVSTTRLPGTAVLASAGGEIPEGKNAVYASSFQLAWDELANRIVNGAPRLERESETARLLNAGRGSAPPAGRDFFAAAGFKKDGIEEFVRRELERRFGEKPGVDTQLRNPDDLLAYAFLFKDLRFAAPFETLKPALRFNGTDPVEAFGIESYAPGGGYEKTAAQVEIVDYADAQDFVLLLRPSSEEDEILIARVPRLRTLEKTASAALKRKGAYFQPRLYAHETLQIPKIDFSLLHRFGDLEQRLANPGLESIAIAKAIQAVRFRLNEEGALLKSEAAVTAAPTASARPIRRLVVDGPFLVALKKRGVERPYFAAWIENAELLVKKT